MNKRLPPSKTCEFFYHRRKAQRRKAKAYAFRRADKADTVKVFVAEEAHEARAKARFEWLMDGLSRRERFRYARRWNNVIPPIRGAASRIDCCGWYQTHVACTVPRFPCLCPVDWNTFVGRARLEYCEEQDRRYASEAAQRAQIKFPKPSVIDMASSIRIRGERLAEVERVRNSGYENYVGAFRDEEYYQQELALETPWLNVRDLVSEYLPRRTLRIDHMKRIKHTVARKWPLYFPRVIQCAECFEESPSREFGVSGLDLGERELSFCGHLEEINRRGWEVKKIVDHYSKALAKVCFGTAFKSQASFGCLSYPFWVHNVQDGKPYFGLGTWYPRGRMKMHELTGEWVPSVWAEMSAVGPLQGRSLLWWNEFTA